MDGFKIEIPNALLAMVTGGFYVYHLDNAEIGQRPSRPWELGLQTVLTGLCGLIAACATWQIIFGAASAAIDRIILTTVINAAVGLALAWYIPQAAAANRCDPLSAASEERVRALEVVALHAIRCRRRREGLARQPASRPGQPVAASRGGGKRGWIRERDRPAARSKGAGRLSMIPKGCRLLDEIMRNVKKSERYPII